MEKEADFFAACLLMPANLLTRAVQELVQTDGPLVFHVSNAYQINPHNADKLLVARPATLERELALARCRNFGNRAFDSLADIFQVSDMAMALRLRELKLLLDLESEITIDTAPVSDSCFDHGSGNAFLLMDEQLSAGHAVILYVAGNVRGKGSRDKMAA